MSDLTWFGWVLILLWTLNPIIAISMIGKPREPYTNGYAICSLVLSALLVLGLLTVGT